MADLCMSLCCFTPLAIACFTIAKHYDPATSPCSTDQLSMDPEQYVRVAGIISFYFIGGTAFNCFCGREDCIGLLAGIAILGKLLTLGWAIYGIVIYASMDVECQSQPIAKMILSWDIIMLIFAAIIFMIICMIFRIVFDGMTSSRYQRNVFTGQTYHKDFGRMNTLQRTKSVYNSYYKRQGTLNELYKSIKANDKKYGATDGGESDGDVSEDNDFDDIQKKEDNDNNDKEKTEKDPLV